MRCLHTLNFRCGALWQNRQSAKRRRNWRSIQSLAMAPSNIIMWQDWKFMGVGGWNSDWGCTFPHSFLSICRLPQRHTGWSTHQAKKKKINVASCEGSFVLPHQEIHVNQSKTFTVITELMALGLPPRLHSQPLPVINQTFTDNREQKKFLESNHFRIHADWMRKITTHAWVGRAQKLLSEKENEAHSPPPKNNSCSKENDCLHNKTNSNPNFRLGSSLMQSLKRNYAVLCVRTLWCVYRWKVRHWIFVSAPCSDVCLWSHLTQ